MTKVNQTVNTSMVWGPEFYSRYRKKQFRHNLSNIVFKYLKARELFLKIFTAS